MERTLDDSAIRSERPLSGSLPLYIGSSRQTQEAVINQIPGAEL
jgi:hypothetical protein